MRRVARKTLFKTGRHGDQVRVLVDEKRDRVEVLYRDADGIPRKAIYSNTREGKAEARAWAQSYFAERQAIAEERKAPKRVTLAELWQEYTKSPAYAALRPKTKIAYSQRFASWMNVQGSSSCPDDTTLLDVDRFIEKGRTAGKALNQVRQIINVARVIYRWGKTRKLVKTNELADFRWQQPKDVETFEPAEYSVDEYDRLLREFSPHRGTKWRPWFVLMVAGHHGQRANALVHMRWEDVDWEEGVIVWPARYQKNGKDLVQPMTWELIAALTTARIWRERMGYTGPWILPAGGGNKKLGHTVVRGPSRARNEFTRKTTRTYRRERTVDQDTPYTYQAAWTAIRKAELRAGVEHMAYRLLHGVRKMNAGNVADVTGDARLGMEWIGDRDPKQMNRYLKRRTERMERAAEAAGNTRTASEPARSNRTENVPQTLQTKAAPEGADVSASESTVSDSLARASGRD